MKKYILLLSSILLLIASFSIKWYEVELLDKLFIFYLLIPIILFIVLIIIIIKTIKVLHKRKNIINIITLLIIIATILLILFFPFREAKTKYELKLYKTERNKVLNLIKNNKLKPDKYNNISLPKNFKKVSISGEITLYQNNKDGLQVGFWIYRGLLSGSTELIYASKEDLIRKNDKYNKIIEITQLKDNWYYVITK